MLQLGRDTPVEIEGKRWTFSRLELGIIEDFAVYVREKEGDPFALLERFGAGPDGKGMPPSVWEAEFNRARQVRDELLSFDLDGPLAQRHLGSAAGAAHFARLWLARNHPDVDLSTALRVFLALADSGRLAAVMASCTGRSPGAAARTPEGNARPAARAEAPPPQPPPAPGSIDAAGKFVVNQQQLDHARRMMAEALAGGAKPWASPGLQPAPAGARPLPPEESRDLQAAASSTGPTGG